MKKLLFVFLSAGICGSLNAQSLSQAEPSEGYQELKPRNGAFHYRSESSSQNVIWSEDFANGIPQGWTQNGTPALALWEYRGPNTAPPDSVGSRGCWAGPNQSGNLGDPINSPSRSNGFMIFDSDYLHSDGDRATNGQGTVPAPHVGRLRTDTIDLSNESGAELSFYMYARRFQAAWYVAISTDGGLTFPDTVEAFPASEIAVNRSTDQNAYFRANLSAIVANEANVVLEFVFDGSLSNANGSGRYYWMIDDIELVTPPRNLLLFTPATAPGTSGEAPAQDIIFDGESSYPKFMHMSEDQIVPISFDANVYNYGTETQTNVGLEVEIIDANTGNVVSTQSSPTAASLSSFDTAYYTTLTTTAWTPSGPGEYLLIYRAISDSISSASAAADTFNFFVGERYGLDDQEIDNYFGTNTGTNGMIAIGILVHLNNEDSRAPGSGEVYLDGIQMQMSCLTDSTADMEIAIYDSSGFVFNSGFPNGKMPVHREVFTFDGGVPCNLYDFMFTSTQAIPTGTYYVMASLFPNAPDGVIRFANGTTWNQPNFASVFQNQNGDWFSGFSNSTTYEAPHFRILRGDPTASLSENGSEDFRVYPNPNNGSFFLESMEGGEHSYKLTNMAGQSLYEAALNLNAGEKVTLEFSLPDGIYILELLNAEGRSTTQRIHIKN